MTVAGFGAAEAFERGGADTGIVGNDAGGGEAGAAELMVGAAPGCFSSQLAILVRIFSRSASFRTAPGEPHRRRRDQRNKGAP